MEPKTAMQQKIKLKNGHGETLVGVLHNTGSDKIVVLCHGLLCAKEKPIIKNLARALVNEEISAFRFDFSGNGQSEGSFQFGNYCKEAEDLRAVMEHFGDKVAAIVGHSKGGNIALIYASKYHDINTVINISGRYHLDRGIEVRLGENYMERIQENGYLTFTNRGKEHRATKESLIERLNTSMRDICLSIDDICRVVTIHGSGDDVVKLDDAEEFNNVIRNHELHVIEGANHGYTKHQDQLASAVVHYVKEHLIRVVNSTNTLQFGGI